MKIYKAYVFRLYPNEYQKEIINKSFGVSRFIYNHFLEEKRKEYKDIGKSKSVYEQIKEIPSLNLEYPFLKEVDSLLLRTSIFDLENAYKMFFKSDFGYPKFKKKGVHDSYKTNNIVSTYKGKIYNSIRLDLNNRIIILPKLKEVKIRGYRNLKEFNKDIKNVTISKEGNKYYVSVCVKEEILERPFKLTHAIGIDLGVKDLVITSEGIKYNKLDTKRIERHIEDLQRKLSKCEKKSIRGYKLKLKIKRLYMKLKNMRKYYIHEITRKLTDDNSLIITENLDVKNMLKKGQKLTKHIANASFSEIIRILKYKIKWKGKKLIQVNTFYPSSQICHRCGYKNIKVKDLSIRKWECDKCGCENDRDINSSQNILFEGLRLYYKNEYC